jgi:hypothetical protein
MGFGEQQALAFRRACPKVESFRQMRGLCADDTVAGMYKIPQFVNCGGCSAVRNEDNLKLVYRDILPSPSTESATRHAAVREQGEQDGESHRHARCFDDKRKRGLDREKAAST